MYMYMHVYTYMYICMYMYIYMYMYIPVLKAGNSVFSSSLCDFSLTISVTGFLPRPLWLVLYMYVYTMYYIHVHVHFSYTGEIGDAQCVVSVPSQLLSHRGVCSALGQTARALCNTTSSLYPHTRKDCPCL